jgi:hypothetical protein
LLHWCCCCMFCYMVHISGSASMVSATSATSSVCTIHADCFALSATCISTANVTTGTSNITSYQPCEACLASHYNLGTAPRMCESGTCRCSGGSVVCGIVPRLHLATYEHRACHFEGSDCDASLRV